LYHKITDCNKQFTFTKIKNQEQILLIMLIIVNKYYTGF